MPTRYPNGLPDLTPGETYFHGDAAEVIGKAEWVLERCRSMLDGMEVALDAETDDSAGEDDVG